MHTEALDLFAKSPFLFLFQTMTISSILFKNNQQHKPYFQSSNCWQVRHADDLFPLPASQNTSQIFLQVLLPPAASCQCQYRSAVFETQIKGARHPRQFKELPIYQRPNMKNPGLPEFIANNRLVISGDAWIWICRYQIFENEDKTNAYSWPPVQ